MNNTAIRIGGVEGKSGALIISALTRGLLMAIQRGQNDVAQAIAHQLGSLGQVNSASVSNSTFKVGS